MIFRPTPLEGAFLIELERKVDERGHFARVFCQEEFRKHGLSPCIAQVNLSMTCQRGTLRGMHYQVPPRSETKVVSCTRGSLLDVVVDLRVGSGTHLQHFAVELNSSDRNALYVPAGFAHGFLTLEDDTCALYFHDEFYSPECERGIRYDDPALKIPWPFEPRIISAKDQGHPPWDPALSVRL